MGPMPQYPEVIMGRSNVSKQQRSRLNKWANYWIGTIIVLAILALITLNWLPAVGLTLVYTLAATAVVGMYGLCFIPDNKPAIVEPEASPGIPMNSDQAPGTLMQLLALALVA